MHFILLIAGTEVIKHPGISAAGASAGMLHFTAALDAEFIYHGKTASLGKLPVSPHGIVSPALISKACLNLLNAEIHIIDLGAHVKPQCPYISYRRNPSACPSSGQAMSLDEVEALFSAGKTFASKFKRDDELIIAECVVGGTTTALGLLRALGYQCQGMISSSIPQGNHNLKEKIVEEGITKALLNDNPLTAVAAVGDPMQAFAAGLAIEANKNNIKTSLAGGSQMLALQALIDKINPGNSYITIKPSPWVVNDKSAKFKQLQELVCPNAIVEFCDLSQKDLYQDLDKEIKKLSLNACEREMGLEEICQQYDQGHVKEGVGMGALLLETSFRRASPRHHEEPTKLAT